MSTATPATRPLVDHPQLDELIAYVEAHHPRSLGGIESARAVNPGRFDEIVQMHLEWAVTARGGRAIGEMVDAFVQFCTDIAMEQARYEHRGNYGQRTYDDVYEAVYGADTMAEYLWGAYLTNFLWPHHLEIAMMFRDRFVAKLDDDARIVELAPGHGSWGVWALTVLPEARVRGFDISPSSIAIAESIAEAAGVGDRADYEQGDALAPAVTPASADACICSFLVEHLERPDALFATIGDLLRPHGIAFVTGALTAAHTDHITEFRRESELVILAENHGLRVLETYSGSPGRTLPDARFLPRSMALLLQKRANDIC